MGKITFNFHTTQKEFEKAGIVRVKKAADFLRDKMKDVVKVGSITRIPGRKKTVKDGKLILASSAPKWMERTPGGMKMTIRTVEKENNVWIIAGNFASWWAVQMESGKGKWKGGKKPFFKTTLKKYENEVKKILENG